MPDPPTGGGSVGTNSGVGLACAGGVVEGAFYEIGALCALEEAVDGLDLNRLSAYVGVSSGAIVATFLAAGVPIRELSRAVAGYARPPLDFRPQVLFRPDWAEFGRRLRLLPSSVASSVRRFLRDPGDMGLLGAALGLGSLIPVGLFDNAPLERFVADVLADRGVANRFGAFRPALRIVATDLDSAEAVCFGTPGWDGIPVSRAVQASTALPVLYRPVEIDGRHYIDGVARRTVHASRALETGAGLVFCVNPIVPVDMRAAPPDARHAGSGLVDAGLPLVLSQTFRTLVHSRMQTGFRGYRHLFPDANTILLEPDVADRTLFFSNVFSFANRQAICTKAYEATRTWLRDHANEVDPILEGHGMRLNRRILADRGLTLHGRPCDSPTAAAADRAMDRLEEVLGALETA
jgi:predicted acylesterase/phospholipase RssA